MVYVPPIAFWGFDDANIAESYSGRVGNQPGRYNGRRTQDTGGTFRIPSVVLGPLLELEVSSGTFGFASITTSDLKTSGHTILRVNFNTGDALEVRTSGARILLVRGSTTLHSTSLIQSRLPSAGEWFHVEVRWVRDSALGVMAVRLNGSEVARFEGDTGTAGAILSNLTTSGSESGGSLYVAMDDAYLVKDPVGDADWLGDLRVVQQYPSGPGSSTEWTPTPAGTPNWETVNEVATSTTDYVSADEGDLTDLYTPTPISGPWRIHGVKIETPARKNISGNAPDVRALNVLGVAEAEYPVQPPGNASWANRGGSVQPLAPDGGEWTVAKLNETEFGVRSVAQ